MENAADNEEYENLKMYVVPDKKEYLTDITNIIEQIKNQPERFTMEKEYSHSLEAPIAKDDEIGKARFYFDGGTEPILTCTLIAANEVAAIPADTPEPTFTPEPTEELIVPDSGGSGTGTLGYIGYLLAGIAGFMLAVVTVLMIRRKAKYHQYHVAAKGRHSAKRYNNNS